MSEPILATKEGRVLTLTLNLSEENNQLTFAACRQLVGHLQDAERDASLGAVLLEARGKAFCTGMDASELLRDEAVELGWIHEELFTFGAKMTLPVVASVRGAVLGAGLGLLANAHVVIAAQGTTFGLTEIRIANFPFMIFRSLSLALGERRSTELALTGRTFGTNEALQYGLVHRVTPPFELEDTTQATVRQMSSYSREAMRRGLDFVHRTRGMDWREAGEQAQRIRSELFHHPDFSEGIQAAREKRKPDWPSWKETSEASAKNDDAKGGDD
jgi:enoyl-CoA hydratase/carnithine racemase